jgi:SAM-dependent methyltransferase
MQGTERTREFYDNEGWKTTGGVAVDLYLFGIKEDGPIRAELHGVHLNRIRSALIKVGRQLNLLECGCGGSPARKLIDLCSQYTGVDFSETGLQLARSSFSDVATPHEFRKADVCELPFSEGEFDALYSAHMIYHIDDKQAQEKALAEMVRVVRSGGVIVVCITNPFPLLFPVRLVIRLVRIIPGLGTLLYNLRPKPILPYRPVSIGWMRRHLATVGSVEIFTGGLPTTYVNQYVTEFRGLGRIIWRFLRWLDIRHEKLAAYLGNFVIYVCMKY